MRNPCQRTRRAPRGPTENGLLNCDEMVKTSILQRLEGDMFETVSREKLDSMTLPEFRALIKEAMYSEDHLLKAMVKIMVLVDPDAIDGIAEWVRTRVG